MLHYSFLLLCGLTLESQAQLYVASAERIFVTSTDELSVHENLENNGTIDYLTLGGTSALSITGTGTITNLKVDKSSGTATITGGMQSVTGVLTLTAGTLAAGGYLTLKSTSTGTARVESHTTAGTVSGVVNVERYFDVNGKAKQWRSLGFPYSNAMALSAISGIAIDYTSGTRSVMYYNEGADNGQYVGSSTSRNAGFTSFAASTETLTAGYGVMAWIYGSAAGTASSGSMTGSLTVSSYGNLNESGNAVSLPVSYTAANANKGWNLLSNPFASSINWNSGDITKTHIGATIYRWNPASASWTTYNGSSGTPSGVDAIIESGSSFFVLANAASPVLTIPQSAKVTTTTGFGHFGRVPQLNVQSQRAAIPVKFAGVRLSVHGQGNTVPDEAYIDLSRADASSAFDSQYDAVSMGRSSGAGISVKDAANKVYAMQFDQPIAEAGVEKRYYPLMVTTPSVGETTLELWTEGSWNPLNSVSLIDNKSGKTMMLRGGKLAYPFRMESLKDEGRFILAVNHVKMDKESFTPQFELKLLGNPVKTEMLDMILTHPTAKPSRWSVLDITGRQVGKGSFANENISIQHRVSVPGIRNAGNYVLKVYMENGEEKQVQFIKQ